MSLSETLKAIGGLLLMASVLGVFVMSVNNDYSPIITAGEWILALIVLAWTSAGAFFDWAGPTILALLLAAALLKYLRS